MNGFDRKVTELIYSILSGRSFETLKLSSALIVVLSSSGEITARRDFGPKDVRGTSEKKYTWIEYGHHRLYCNYILATYLGENSNIR